MRKLLFLILVSFVFTNVSAQKDSLKFTYSPNKFYVGTNIAPIAITFLNGQNFQPEWKILGKYRLTDKNHYVRLSYSFINYSNFNGSYYSWNSPYYPNWYIPNYYSIDDSTDVNIGFQQNHINQHVVRVGYEYQFKIGKKRSSSINLSSDLQFGIIGSDLNYINDTLRYSITSQNGSYLREFVNGTHNLEKLRGPLFQFGFMPSIGFNIPIKRYFDINFEMGFSSMWSNDPYWKISSYVLNYRPSLMLSYRFDEIVRKNKGK